MPLRPIDAIFVHPKRKVYVVYCRGALWQLPRMSINNEAWQRRQPYTDSPSELYLSRCQIIHDTVLAKKLCTLNLPTSLHSSTLLQFESWWDTQGFDFIKDNFTTAQPSLVAHQSTSNPSVAKPKANDSTIALDNKLTSRTVDNITSPQTNKSLTMATETIDIFTTMLADLANEVRRPNI